MVAVILVFNVRGPLPPSVAIHFVALPPARSHHIMQRFGTLICLFLLATPSLAQAPKNRAGLDLFEKKIRPALIRYCYECHAVDSDDIGGELLLDSRAAVLAGGETGPSLVPGKPRDSLLMRAIEYRDLEMPPDEKMPDDVIAAFRRWITLGAPDPRKKKTSMPTEDEAETPVDLWSFKPIAEPEVPQSNNDSWSKSDVDRFVFSKLAEHQLAPNADADAKTLIRRVYYDLVGLPPTAEQVDEYRTNPTDEKLQTIVDRLLQSPQFGERWGRHWLDVARYGESAGSSRDVLMLYAWRYRDYVIDAFNRDVPFDRFVTEQIAGDLLEADSDQQRDRLTVATGLLAIGSKSLNGGNLVYDVIDDQIDVVSKSVLGLTVSCARCHDHKFDPIPTKDYYSLAGFFLSTDTRYGGSINRPKSAAQRSAAYLTLGQELSSDEAKALEKSQKQVDQLSKQVNSSRKRIKTLESKVPVAYRKDPEKELAEDLKPADAKLVRQFQGACKVLDKRLADLEKAKQSLGPEPDYALGVRDAKKVTDAKVLIRGEKGQAGEVSPRGFLTQMEPFADVASECGVIDNSESGRRQLAHWLTHPSNPLTPRVAVNRIWQHLMGSGIVATVDNFGSTGDTPSHPELLDHLSSRFVKEHQWSTKSMIRELVLSRTYRMSSAMNDDAYQADPDNRLRWRMPRRRLDAEQMRDSMLAVSGSLDLQPLDGSLVMEIGEGEVGRNINTSVLDKPFNHRSVYLPIIRGIIPEELQLFDFPEPSNVQGLRDSNTTPTQSLYLMNGKFALRVADQFARGLIDDPTLASQRDRAAMAYQRCFGSAPSDAEVDRAMTFIDQLAQSTTDKADTSHFALATYCQTLIASARFRFID